MTRTIVLAVVAMSLAVPSDAALRPKQDCISLVVPYEKRAEIANPAFSLELSAPGGGSLVYVGSSHTDDPADPMFARIDAAWERAKPTIAFYEGPDRPIFDDRDETIRRTGESGYVRFLAKKAGLPVARLEPSPKALIDYLLTKFSREQVELFFILGEAARLRERKELGEAEIRSAIEQLMGRAAQMGLVGRTDNVPPGLTLQWVESQDKPVDLPPVRNFGRVLLESVVPAAVTGQSCLEMGPDGILYRLQIRSDELVDRPGAHSAQ